MDIMLLDCHCHILPGIDDGAQTLEDSVFLAGKLVEWGYRRAICTSHCSYQYRNTPSTVGAACEILRAELLRRAIPLELFPSMEYRMIPEAWPGQKYNLMPWEGNHVLVELPLHDPAKIGDIVPLAEMKSLIERGYQPVLAHPERYFYLDMSDYLSYKDAGVQFQRNLGAREGLYGPSVSAKTKMLEAEGMYDWLGTDLHNRQYAEFFDLNVFGSK